MQIRPILLNNFVVYNNKLTPQRPRYNDYIGKDTVCFTSNINKDYKELMYNAWDARIADTAAFTRFHSITGYNEALANFDVKNFIRLGGESAVFELQDGNILKLATEKYAPFLKKYHAPEIKRGLIKLSSKHLTKNTSPSQRYYTDIIYYVIQEKGRPLTESSLGWPLFDSALDSGYYVVDFGPEQFAYFNMQNREEIKCVDLGCITNKRYPISRDFEAIERMTANDICNQYGMTYFTLEKHFSDILKSDEAIRSFIESIAPRIKNGENIFKVMNEFLKEHGKPAIHHIKFP